VRVFLLPLRAGAAGLTLNRGARCRRGPRAARPGLQGGAAQPAGRRARRSLRWPIGMSGQQVTKRDCPRSSPNHAHTAWRCIG